MYTMHLTVQHAVVRDAHSFTSYEANTCRFVQAKCKQFLKDIKNNFKVKYEIIRIFSVTKVHCYDIEGMQATWFIRRKTAKCTK